ncbi:MAG: hypothetical protein MZV70_46625 [Desulfobacterales bacterium]|nr:hypothetical protein [Desulfobacterales bacterium]
MADQMAQVDEVFLVDLALARSVTRFHLATKSWGSGSWNFSWAVGFVVVSAFEKDS